MSNFSSYKTTAFKETQKFFVLDPATGSPSFVQGSDLVSYITPMLNYVRADSTRLSAENTDYDVGTLVQTSGATSPGDNFAATYLVVEGGSGDFPMLNGNDLLVIKGDEFLREQLAQNTAGDGSDLVAHTGTSDTVTEALDKRALKTFNVDQGSSVDRELTEKAKEEISVFDFFPDKATIEEVQRGDSTTADHTPYVQAFIDALYTTNFGDDTSHNLFDGRRHAVFPPGVYNISQVVIENLYNAVIEMRGARFRFIGSSSVDSMIKFVNGSRLSVMGSWVVDAEGSALVENAVLLTVGPGDEIGIPAPGGFSSIRLNGLYPYRVRTGLKIGSYDNDVSKAEIYISQFASGQCPTPFHIAGSQTGATITNSLLVSQPGPFGGAYEESALKMEGAFLMVSNCAILHLSSSVDQLIHLSPQDSTLSPNGYPKLNISNCSVESAATVVRVDNPRGITSTVSEEANLEFNGVQGYIGGIPPTNSLMVVDTGEAYKGTFNFIGGNLYAGSTLRSGANLRFAVESPEAKVTVDNSSFGKGCLSWLEGIDGGRVIHPMTRALKFSDLNSQSISAGANSALKFQTILSTGDFKHYNGFYNTTNGILQTPFNKLTGLSFSISTRLTSQGDGYVSILKDGVEVKSQTVSSSDRSINIDYTELGDIDPLTQYTVVVNNTGSTAISWGSSSNDTFYGSYETK